tara:strand:+ start:1588 stop:2367 length:780 start_codon:yes stop_codon:yes gene_type:complete
MTNILIEKGFRSRKNSLYTKGSNQPFKISRSKFNNFLDCQRCFYLDRVKGLKEPSMPGWALNSAVDELLKKEFDIYRKKKIPHPIMKKYKLNFIPFHHTDINHWRDALRGGISYLDKETNLIFHGGIDDIWLNIDTKELIVVEYKAQSSNLTVTNENYLENKYHQSYKIQMDIYVHILRKMNFKVSDMTYFLVCNGEKNFKEFNNKINFTTTLVPYKSNNNWVTEKIKEMKKILDGNEIPDYNINCEKCIYLGSEKICK